MQANMIAPCGMNCALCIGHIREKNRCEGCNGNDRLKPEYCRTCKVVVCEKRKALPSQMCCECADLPCTRIKQLDKRYRTKYGMSMMENLAYIKEHGLEAFVKHEEARWACPECGATLSVHRKACMQCGWNRPFYAGS
jgi:hypothetical protein